MALAADHQLRFLEKTFLIQEGGVSPHSSCVVLAVHHMLADSFQPLECSCYRDLVKEFPVVSNDDYDIIL